MPEPDSTPKGVQGELAPEDTLFIKVTVASGTFDKEPFDISNGAPGGSILIGARGRTVVFSAKDMVPEAFRVLDAAGVKPVKGGRAK